MTTSLKIGSFNTFQLFTNPIADDLVSSQLEEIISSDIDILCLQELFSPYKVQTYSQSLSTSYPYSFSALDIRSEDEFIIPRTSCSAEQIEAFTSCSICEPLFPLNTFAGCMATYCSEEWDSIYLTECASCFLFAPTLLSTDDIQTVGAFCGNPHNYLLNQTDGTMIISKLPIISTWSLKLPSWLYLENRVNIAQIDVCPKGSKSCTDSVIVACTHLNPTAWKDPVSTFVAADGDQRHLKLTSHIQLNEYQIEYLLDNILSDAVSPWDSADILGLFIAGDLNVGQTWIEDNFALFEAEGYKDYGDGECTVCVDPEDDDYNVLNTGGETWILDANSGRDLDHVMVREDYLHNFKDVKWFERIFLEEYNISNQKIPLSDHWGVQLRMKVEKKPIIERKWIRNQGSIANPAAVNVINNEAPRNPEYQPRAPQYYGNEPRPEFYNENKGGFGDVAVDDWSYLAVNILVSIVSTLCVISVCLTMYYCFTQMQRTKQGRVMD